MANALTAARLLLVVPFTLLMLRDDRASALLAALVLAAGIATDVLDGRVARRRATASARGTFFDHAVDCLFVTGGLAAGAARGVPWVLPVLVVAAFGQYVVDSYWVHRQRALRTSGLGRWNGILYFAPLVGDVLARAGTEGVRPLVTALAWVLVLSTVLSMGERLWAVRQASRTAPGSPAAGTAGRPPR
jgi:phosphatidylglycerophosphate synthase